MVNGQQNIQSWWPGGLQSFGHSNSSVKDMVPPVSITEPTKFPTPGILSVGKAFVSESS